MKSSTHGISVVIPMHNCEATIYDTLDSLVSSDFSPDEVICVDDASTDETVAVVKRFADHCSIPVNIVELSSKIGPAGARNHGAKESRYSHILFVDSDVVLHVDTIYSLMKRSQTLRYRGAVVSLYDEVNLAGGWLSDFTTLYSAFNYSQDAENGSSHFSSQCAVVSTHDFFHVGGFDESYPRATVEDIDFGLRLHAASVPVVAESKARVSHNSAYDFRRFIRNYWNKCFDFSNLFISRGKEFRENRGYGGRHAQFSMAAIAFFLIAFSATTITSHAWWAVMGTCLFLSIHWRRFILCTKYHFGARRVLPFCGLKILVLGICGLASITAVISKRLGLNPI